MSGSELVVVYKGNIEQFCGNNSLAKHRSSKIYGHSRKRRNKSKENNESESLTGQVGPKLTNSLTRIQPSRDVRGVRPNVRRGLC